MCTPSEVNPLEDAQRVFQVLQHGGIAIIPTSVGYGIVAIDQDALSHIFTTKRRQAHKRHAMIGSYTLHQKIHRLSPLAQKMVKNIAVDLDLPIGVVAPYNTEHPIIQKMSPRTLAESTVDGTLAMLVNGGPLQEHLCQLTTEAELPLLGSSANLTGTGTKILVQDIEVEIRDIADIVIDYGRAKFSHPRPSSTMIDFDGLKALRYGACYDVIQDFLWRFYNISLPSDPDREVLSSGHILPG